MKYFRNPISGLSHEIVTMDTTDNVILVPKYVVPEDRFIDVRPDENSPEEFAYQASNELPTMLDLGCCEISEAFYSHYINGTKLLNEQAYNINIGDAMLSSLVDDNTNTMVCFPTTSYASEPLDVRQDVIARLLEIAYELNNKAVLGLYLNRPARYDGVRAPYKEVNAKEQVRFIKEEILQHVALGSVIVM